MTCKDNCLCYEPCGLIMKNHYQNCEECDCFEDKSKYIYCPDKSKIIELACKVGDKIYFKMNNEKCEAEIEYIGITKNSTNYYYLDGLVYVTDKTFNKVWFNNKELKSN